MSTTTMPKAPEDAPVEWTNPMLRTLLSVLFQERSQRRMTGDKFDPRSYERAVTIINLEHRREIKDTGSVTITHVKHKVASLKQSYARFKCLINHPGSTWTEEIRKLREHPTAWNRIISENPNFANLRKLDLNFYPELDSLLDGKVAVDAGTLNPPEFTANLVQGQESNISPLEILDQLMGIWASKSNNSPNPAKPKCSDIKSTEKVSSSSSSSSRDAGADVPSSGMGPMMKTPQVPNTAFQDLWELKRPSGLKSTHVVDTLNVGLLMSSETVLTSPETTTKEFQEFKKPETSNSTSTSKTSTGTTTGVQEVKEPETSTSTSTSKTGTSTTTEIQEVKKPETSISTSKTGTSTTTGVQEVKNTKTKTKAPPKTTSTISSSSSSSSTDVKPTSQEAPSSQATSNNPPTKRKTKNCGNLPKKNKPATSKGNISSSSSSSGGVTITSSPVSSSSSSKSTSSISSSSKPTATSTPPKTTNRTALSTTNPPTTTPTTPPGIPNNTPTPTPSPSTAIEDAIFIIQRDYAHSFNEKNLGRLWSILEDNSKARVFVSIPECHRTTWLVRQIRMYVQQEEDEELERKVRKFKFESLAKEFEVWL